MEAILLNLPENGRFHFGIVAPEPNIALAHCSEIPHSDTLFSALVRLCAKMYPESTNDFVDAFETGKIQISSGNYVVEFTTDNETERVFFLPKPTHFDLYQSRKGRDRKRFRRIRYISKTIWEKGLTPGEWDRHKCFIIGGKFLLHPKDLNPRFRYEVDDFSDLITEPKIADHARKRENNIFFQTDLCMLTTKLYRRELENVGFPDTKYFSARPHFYFLVKTDPEEKMSRLFNFLIKSLPFEGIGGGISTGTGKIESVEKVDWGFNWSLTSDDTISDSEFVSASLIAGSKKELKKIPARKILIRGGRRTVFQGDLMQVKMLAEGALIKEESVGRIAQLNPKKDLKKEERYLRYGKAFALPISKKFEKKSPWLKRKTK